MAEQVVFEQTIEGLFVRGLGTRMTPRCRARLKELGVDLSGKLLPAYPFSVWMQSLAVAAEEIFPSLPAEQAHQQLGALLIDGYRETFLGRAVLGMIRVLGPRRMLHRATQNFRSGNNYTETRIVDLTPTSLELWMNEVGPYPTFTAGIILAGLRAAGATHPRVELFGHDGHACTYRCAWGSGDSSATSTAGSISSR